MVWNFNNEYFTKEKYYFNINEEFVSKYHLDDMDEFIIKNADKNVDEIRIMLQDKYNINNINSRSLIWNKIHVLYTKDIVVWNDKNPFSDVYGYTGKNYNFKIEVSLNKSYTKYKEGVWNLFSKKLECYEKNINNIIDEPLRNVIFFSIKNGAKRLGTMTLLRGVKRNTYIIGCIYLTKEISMDILKNALIWAGSRLCLIFGHICKNFEFRIDKKDREKFEIKKLLESGFEIREIKHKGIDCLLLEKNI